MNDEQLITIIEQVTEHGGRVVIECVRSVWPDGSQGWGWTVAGGDLGGAIHPTLRESLSGWATSLVKLAELDPHTRFADLIPAATPTMPVARLQALVNLLYPEDMTPNAKRIITNVINEEQHD